MTYTNRQRILQDTEDRVVVIEAFQVSDESSALG